MDQDKKNTLSLCMIVKNEEDNLERCLESVREAVDEMVIVDTGSTDGTVAIAEKFGARVFHHPWQGSFSEARNHALQYAVGEWILQMDGDEELEGEDIPILKKVIQSGLYNAIHVALLNDSPEGWSKHYFQRIVRRGKARYEGIVHNQLVFEGAELQSEIRIYHYGYNLPRERMQVKFQRTGELLRKQIDEDPTNPFAYQNMLRILRAEQKIHEVIFMGRKALAVCADRMSDIHRQMISYDTAYSLMLAGQLKESERMCRDVLAGFGRNLDMLFILGGNLVEQKRFEEAIEVFGRYLLILKEERANPKHTRLIVDTYSFDHKAWGNIADCHYELGEYDRAENAARKAAALRPDLPVYTITRARILLKQERIQDAQTILDEVDRDVVPSVDFYLKWYTLAKRHPELGDPAAIVKRGLDRHPGSDELHNSLAHALLDRDQALAKKQWFRALKINPHHMGAHVGLVKIYSREGKIHEMIHHVDVVLEKGMQKGILREVGGCCFHAGEYSKAVDCFSKALALDSKDIELLSDIATCYARLGQYEASLLGYQEALRISPGHTTVLNNLKVLRRLVEKQAETIEMS